MPARKFHLRAAAVDPLGNWSKLPVGEYRAFRSDHPGEPGSVLTKKRLAQPSHTLTLALDAPQVGTFFYHLQGPNDLEGTSNVQLCQKGSPRLNLYFGDIHGHSRLSDGTGTPDDYYRYAREVSGLDIAALTDHADFGTIRLQRVWDKITRATNRANKTGQFVTFLGFEWTNWVSGHRNVYYKDGAGPLLRSIDPESDTPNELWSQLAEHEAMTIAHHVAGGPIHTDWSFEPDEKEYLVEVSSIHGTSEVLGGEGTIYGPVRGAFVRDALGRGYKLGMIGAGDTHDGHPGQRSQGAQVNGLMGVFAPTLDRDAIWAAMKRRQVYATSGPKIILFFRVAESPMGSEVKWPAEKGPIPIALQAFGCDNIKYLEIIRNGEVVLRKKGTGVQIELLTYDEPPSGEAQWYYARVVQEDSNLAWSSPVWVSP
jgi:hypothetical protein